MQFDFYNRYIAGEEISVWRDIYSLKEISAIDDNWQDLLKVLQETFERVKYNIDFIFVKLKECKCYSFKESNPIKSDYVKSNYYFNILKNKVNEFGYMPFTLDFFYRNIESINFLHSLERHSLFKYADPLFIDSAEHLLDNMDDGSWEELMYENKDNKMPVYVEFSPDYYHKDNVSGGLPYGIEITPTQQVDSYVVNTPYGNIYFVEYLRLCFKYGGFPNISDKNDNYIEFVENLRLGLKNI